MANKRSLMNQTPQQKKLEKKRRRKAALKAETLRKHEYSSRHPLIDVKPPQEVPKYFMTGGE